jgi:hypothetical protein
MGTHSASSAMPGLPGAQKSWVAWELCFSFQTKACSRPPPPITRILISIYANSSQNHQQGNLTMGLAGFISINVSISEHDNGSLDAFVIA